LVRSGRALAVGLASATALVACSVLTPPDPRLCTAAQNLSAAMTLVETAIDTDAGGDLARAQGLATEARSVADGANQLLQHFPAGEHSIAWTALVEAYKHAGKAADSLLPAYADAHGSGGAELAAARTSMATARTGLPAMCFDIPADLETPGAS
jgi:hypothetical protein